MTLKRLLVCLALLSNLGWAQTLVRYDAPIFTVSTQFTPLVQSNLPPNSPVLSVCNSPANAVPCTNYATVFQANGTACPNGAQDTPIPATTSSCQPTGDAVGQIGFWAYPGTYDYTVCIQNNCLGPYTVTLGAASGGSSSVGPAGTLQMAGTSAGTFAASPCVNNTGSTVTCSGPFNVTGPFGIGASPPGACGSATGCVAFNYSSGSLLPTASQATVRFLAGVLNCGTIAGEAPCFVSGFPAGAQPGDALRYNVNGDSAWDAVNATYKNTIVTVEGGSPFVVGVFEENPITTGSASSLNNPAGVDSYNIVYSASASASTNTVIGVAQGTSGNASVIGWNAFYRWTLRWAAGTTSGARYWLGLGNYSVTGTVHESYGMLGSPKYATDNPQVSTLAFRYHEGTDTSWQACAQQGGGSQTIVATGVAIDTNPHFFDIASNGTTATFFIDHVVVATISTNVPNTTSGTGLGQGLFSQFWTGDNLDAATAISATFYWMGVSSR
jgi:hypothetical protein